MEFVKCCVNVGTVVVFTHLPRTLREIALVAIIECVPHAFRWASVVRPAKTGLKQTVLAGREQRHWKRGQVAQVVERSPEKAGVGGSTPSLATIFSITCKRCSRSLGHNWSQFNSLNG